jgi:hydroxyacid-oxoacid transhydrogenase
MTTHYQTETIFTWGAPPIRFGIGAADELGDDLIGLGAERVLLVTDPGVAATGVVDRLGHAIGDRGIKVELYADVHVEPTDRSLEDAAEAARSLSWDAIVAVGGGSSIDTAKAINLLTTQPGSLMDYVNRPIGQGRAPTNPLKPLIAVPTTAGTGSESTPVCVLDILSLRVKTGISHPRLRPTLAVVDPLLTLTVPPAVTAATGLDVVCHALESYTARPYTAYARRSPAERVAYCGANPVSDLWAERALALIARSLRRAVHQGMNLEARSDMALAASFAGMGFGNAGVHIPHACAYPIAGMVRTYHPEDYPGGEPMVPHGQSVAVTAPAAFRFTYPANPERHTRAARILDPDVADSVPPEEALPTALRRLMDDIGAPRSLHVLGYNADDIPDLVEGTLKQQRLLTIAPRTPGAADLAAIFEASLTAEA